jgi:hypothetical protein
MSVSNERGTRDRASSRGRSPSGTSKSASGTKSTSRAKSPSRSKSSSGTKSASRTSSASRASSPSRAKASSGNRSAASSRRQPSRTSTRSQSRREAPAAQPQGNGNSNGVISKIFVPVATATIGVAGGVLLGRNGRQRNRKLLGVEVPAKIDFGGVSQQLGEAGRQFGKLASEVRTVRQKAEQIGRALN